MGGEFKDIKELNEWLRRNREPEVIFVNEKNIVDYIREKEKSKMEGLVEGRIVHFVLDNNIPKGVTCRPAIIVNAWGGELEDGMINIVVFLDGSNDDAGLTTLFQLEYKFSIQFPLMWKTSVKYSEAKEAGTWHWPERN